MANATDKGRLTISAITLTLVRCFEHCQLQNQFMTGTETNVMNYITETKPAVYDTSRSIVGPQVWKGSKQHLHSLSATQSTCSLSFTNNYPWIVWLKTMPWNNYGITLGWFKAIIQSHQV